MPISPVEAMRLRANKPMTRAQKGGLVAIVGVGVAAALFKAIPKEESGRTVKVEISDSGSPTITHVSGRQYLSAYLDMVGVATACDGLTRDEFGRPIKIGSNYTEAECTAMLERALIAHARAVMACTPGLALSSSLSIENMREGPRFAAVSGAYNYGTGLYCRSTAMKRFNAGDYTGGCVALTWFNRAGGRVVRGLVLRRERERKVCIHGLGALS